MRKRGEIDIFLVQHSAMPHTSSATTDAVACLGFTIQPHPALSRSQLFSVVAKTEKDLSGQILFLIKKSRLQYASGFRRKRKTKLKDGIQKLTKVAEVY